MKKLLLYFFMLLTAPSLAQIEPKEFIVNGKISGASKDVQVVLSQPAEGGAIVNLDSIKVSDDGSFQLKGVEKDRGSFFTLSAPGLKDVLLLVEGGETLSVESDLSSGKSLVTGSENMKYCAQINDISQDIDSKMEKWSEEYRIAEDNKDTKKTAEIQAAFGEAQKIRSEKIRELLPKMGTSFVAFYAASSFLSTDSDIATLKKLASDFESLNPTPTLIKGFIDIYKNLGVVNMGDEAPDFALNDPTGKEIKLSSLRGKYVLIDFWASWCGPCRKENPHVVKIYEKYKDKGFEIYGVSLDRNKNAWIEAIKKDNLTWIQGCDVVNDKTVVREMYGVLTIPTTFLLDPNGVVIGKNLKGDALDKRIEEFLNKN